MNLYLIFQGKNTGYDTYDSAVVVAESEEEARNTHPSEHCKMPDDSWCSVWVKNPKDVKVKTLGVADPLLPKGVVCASFNAG